jgi:hypothetical protein
MPNWITLSQVWVQDTSVLSLKLKSCKNTGLMSHLHFKSSLQKWCSVEWDEKVIVTVEQAKIWKEATMLISRYNPDIRLWRLKKIAQLYLLMVSNPLKSESELDLLYDRRFTVNQFFLASFFFQIVYCHVCRVTWLIIMGFGFEEWIYWHLFTVTINYDSS